MSLALNEVRNVKVGNTWMRAEITGEVIDIERRLRSGDATVGWQGADDLWIELAVPTDDHGNYDRTRPCEFYVMGRDAHGGEYVALIWPRCDASLLRRLAEIDPRVHNPLKAWEAEIAKAEKEAAARQQEQFDAFVDKAQWALMKDTGHLNGLTKRQHTVDGFRDKGNDSDDV